MAIQAGIGARVGEYVLVRKLGEGGMAEVWLARHTTSAQLRAIKFLNQQFQGIPEVEARFQTEGESQLVHPNIVRIYQVGQETGSSYLVMQFIDGRDLEKILDSRRGPLTVPEAVDIAMQILAGLGFAHASGIVHRDIKPSNVLVDSEGQAYLMDFGIAKALRGTRSVTQVNSRLGTPDYMSPEQIRNPRDVDRRSDIYSFGCLFYELLTGWPPFDRGAGYETEHDIKTAHCNELPTPPVERKSNLPAALNDIALACLAKAKEDRPQSCEEILAALDAYRAAVTRPQQRGGNDAEQAKRENKISTGPGAGLGAGLGDGLRRETVVIPQSHSVVPDSSLSPHSGPPQQGPGVGGSGHGMAGMGAGGSVGGGFGNQSRTPTVTDDALAGMLQTPRETTIQAKAQAGGQPANGGVKAEQPWELPKVPEYVPQVVVTPPPVKGVPKALVAGGGLLLVIALAGGAWAYFHRPDNPGPKPAEVSPAATPFFSPSGGEFQHPQTVRVTINDSTPGAKIYFTTDGSAPSTSSPLYTGPITIDNSETLKALAVAQGYSESALGTAAYTFTSPPPPSPVVPKPVVKTKPPVALATGTLTWTGFVNSTGTHLTIVRSLNQAWKVGQMGQAFGQLSGTMFPAGPVKVNVASGQAVLVAPNAATNYNSMDMFLPSAGQQTIVIRWTALSKSQ